MTTTLKAEQDLSDIRGNAREPLLPSAIAEIHIRRVCCHYENRTESRNPSVLRLEDVDVVNQIINVQQET
jgi:hypothetical protein